MLDNTGRYGGAALGTLQETFEASLITAVPPGARLLRCFEATAEEAAAAEVAARRRLLGSQAASSGAAAVAGGGPQGAPPPGAGGAQVCYGPSPYPDLEAFITRVCCEVRDLCSVAGADPAASTGFKG